MWIRTGTVGARADTRGMEYAPQRCGPARGRAADASRFAPERDTALRVWGVVRESRGVSPKLAVVDWLTSACARSRRWGRLATMSELANFSARAIDGSDVDLATYAGEVLLVVNTASQCGFTPQYQGLQKLQDEYADRGFAVLGFPCDQFGGQEPGEDAEIAGFCERNFGVTFPLFSKVEVNGDQAAPDLPVAPLREGRADGQQDQVELHQVPDRSRRRRCSSATPRPPSRRRSPLTSRRRSGKA